MTWLAREIQDRPRRRYSHRFLFIPGTIGSITWLARNEEKTGRIAHGLVAANLGDPGPFHYKKSRRGDAEIDRAVLAVLRASGGAFGVEDFVPFGYDERQYGSPGFDLAVGSLTRTPYGRYPEYHTSADNLDFIQPEALEGSLRTYLAVVDVLEGNRRYLNLNPKCEPQLGRRGLYRTTGGDDAGRERELALLWVLNLSDGEHDLLGISERSGMGFAAIRGAAEALLQVGLLREVGEE
jgi:aminopeptidase-like protein